MPIMNTYALLISQCIQIASTVASVTERRVDECEGVIEVGWEGINRALNSPLFFRRVGKYINYDRLKKIGLKLVVEKSTS